MNLKKRCLTEFELQDFLKTNLIDWCFTGFELKRTFETGDWKSSIMLANSVGYLAESYQHHPSLRVNYDSVEITLSTHDVGGVTEKDLMLAQKIEEVCLWPTILDHRIVGDYRRKNTHIRPSKIMMETGDLL